MMKIAFENTKTDKVDVTFWLQGSTPLCIQTIVIPTDWFLISENTTPKLKKT